MLSDYDTLARDAQLVLHLTREEAARLNDPRISPDHLVLGLTRARGTAVGQLLAEEGADLDLGRETFEFERRERRLGRAGKAEPWTPPGFTPALRHVLQQAADFAARFGRQQVRSEHLLLACLAHNGGRGVNALFAMRLYTPAWDRIWAAALDALDVPEERRRPRPTPDYRPPPTWLRREELRAVVPVARILERGDHRLVILSLEEYSDGFLLRCDYTLRAAPPRVEVDASEIDQRSMPPRMRTERPFFRLARARLVFAVRDNLAHEYAPADGPSGGGGSGSANSWRQDFHPGFLPALDEAATSLVLETRELRWERQPFPTGKEDPVRVDPLGWTIEIPLSLRHRVSDVGVAE